MSTFSEPLRCQDMAFASEFHSTSIPSQFTASNILAIVLDHTTHQRATANDGVLIAPWLMIQPSNPILDCAS